MKIDIPIKLETENFYRASNFYNSKHCWNIKKKKDLYKLAIEKHRNTILYNTLPCKIILTRKAPRSCDDDNLLGSFKTIRDVIANILIPGKPLGHTDNDPRLIWIYNQEKTPKYYGFSIEILPCLMV